MAIRKNIKQSPINKALIYNITTHTMYAKTLTATRREHGRVVIVSELV